MNTDKQLLALVDAAFAAATRPEHFTDFRHCCECAEHDALLRSRDRDSLRIDDVGHPGWDPLCFCSAEGIAYFFPALARLALAAPSPRHGWYGEQLLFHLGYGFGDNRFLLCCGTAQRQAVAALLGHLIESRAALIDAGGCADEFLRCHALWRGERPDTPREPCR